MAHSEFRQGPQESQETYFLAEMKKKTPPIAQNQTRSKMQHAVSAFDHFSELRFATDQGDADAHYQTGLLAESIEEALKYFKLAAEQGHLLAQRKVGSIFDAQGQYKQAFEYFKLAADQGDDISQNNLGYYYQEGLGIEKDFFKAFHFYQLAHIPQPLTLLNRFFQT